MTAHALLAVLALLAASTRTAVAQSQCATVGTTASTALPTSAAAATWTGVYNNTCPYSCGNACVYGCLLCADQTYIAMYGATCSSAAFTLTPGALITVAGTASLYPGSYIRPVNEWNTCTGITVVTAAPVAASPPPPIGTQCATMSGTGAYGGGIGVAEVPVTYTGILSTSCPAACGTACSQGCLVCADNTYIALQPASCAVNGTAGSLASISGTAYTVKANTNVQVYAFYQCTAPVYAASGAVYSAIAFPPRPPSAVPPSPASPPPMLTAPPPAVLGSSQCASMGTTLLGVFVATPFSMAGIYQQAACPISCGTACR